MRMSEFYFTAAARCLIERGNDARARVIARTLRNFARQCQAEEEAQIAALRRGPNERRTPKA